MPEVECLFNEVNSCMLNSIDIMQETIIKNLCNLKINKAPGVDGIFPRLLVENAVELSEPLLYIYIYIYIYRVNHKWYCAEGLEKGRCFCHFKKG